MTEQEILFLFTVRDTCKANPEMVAEVVQAANAGLRDRFDEMRKLSADIEAVAMLAMVRRTKGIDKALLAKLKQVKPATIGQASRITGVDPSHISVLLFHLDVFEKQRNVPRGTRAAEGEGNHA